MFDKSIIIAAADGLVGFNRSIHPFYDTLNVHKGSTSNYYINALSGVNFNTIQHTLFTDVKDIDLTLGEKYVIRSSGGNFTNVGATDNDIGTEFVATGTEPTSWGDAYLELISCNSYIDDVYEQETINIATRFINSSKDKLKSRALLSNHSVIGGIASEKLDKNSRFVGFVLQPAEGNNVKNILTKIGYFGDTAESFTIYLYETSQKEAIATFDFDYTTPLSQQWKDITNFIIKYDNTRQITTGQGSSVKAYSNTGSEDVSAGATVDIAFDVPFEDVNYQLIPSVRDNTGTGQMYQITNETKDGFSITALADVTLDWIAVKTVTDTYSANTYSGGIGQKYILGYYEDDLSGQAMKMEFNQSLKNFSVFGKYLSVFPIEIPNAKLNGTNIPGDLSNLGSYISDYTNGLYFKFTANADYTNLLEDNIDMFAEPLQYALAIRILEDALASVSDGVHNSTKDAAVDEWMRLSRKYKGILYGGNIQLGQELKYEKGLLELLTLDFSNLDPIVMKRNADEWTIGNLV